MPDQPTLTDPAKIQELVEKHCPSNHAPLPADLASRLGATHYAGRYFLSDEPYLLEGLAMLHGLGLKTAKLWLGRDLPGYAFNSRWNLPKDARLVDVVKHRPLSRALAERLGVTHASPQAIILKDGVPAWHRSHFDIEAEAMRRVVSHLSDGDPEPLSELD